MIAWRETLVFRMYWIEIFFLVVISIFLGGWIGIMLGEVKAETKIMKSVWNEKPLEIGLGEYKCEVIW